MVMNLELWKRRLAALPQVAKDAAEQQLDLNAQLLVDKLKLRAPSDDETRKTLPLAESGPTLRDSIRFEAALNRELARVIICDPKDRYGHGYALHVEFGHRTKSGGHVPARPFFFPTYRMMKATMRVRMTTATRKAIRNAFEGK